jgi:hypothetical protein
MKRSFWLGLAVFLAIFILPTIAKPEHLALGSYSVSFDAGKELQDWNIKKEDTETYSGEPQVVYSAVSNNVIIYIECSEEGTLLLTINDWRKESEEYLKTLGILSTTYPRVIDGHDGFVGETTSLYDLYFRAGWYLNDNTTIEVISYYPWNEGTLQLLKTINVTMTG